jgi:uncharacterized membrane protein
VKDPVCLNNKKFITQCFKQACTSMSSVYKLFIIFLFASAAWLSTVTPPFQSPDEFEHITRAYLLGQGEFVLGAPTGQSSGGQIDAGLNDYMNRFSSLPFHPERKLTLSEIEFAKTIEWTGNNEFRPALGMAYYFPAIYAVHTAGLFLGKYLDLSVDTSYRLTRILLLLATCLILYYSFLLYNPPALALGLLIIPMSLFQFSSASLDGIATAIAIFIISAFMRIRIDGEKSNPYLCPLMLLGWLLIASSRLQLFPMILLPIVATIFYLRRPIFLVFVGFCAAFVIGWQIVIMKTIVDGRVKLGATSSEIVTYYLQHPLSLIEVFVRTLTDEGRLRGFFSSFFGLLGWLDTPFTGKEYIYLLIIISFIFLLSLKSLKDRQSRLTASLLLTVSIGAITIVFLAMLVTWTPHPATLIEGIQGRYFLLPAILIAYALNNNLESSGFYRRILLFTILLLLGIYSFIITDQLLLDRYYFTS